MVSNKKGFTSFTPTKRTQQQIARGRDTGLAVFGLLQILAVFPNLSKDGEVCHPGHPDDVHQAAETLNPVRRVELRSGIRGPDTQRKEPKGTPGGQKHNRPERGFPYG